MFPTISYCSTQQQIVQFNSQVTKRKRPTYYTINLIWKDRWTCVYSPAIYYYTVYSMMFDPVGCTSYWRILGNPRTRNAVLILIFIISWHSSYFNYWNVTLYIRTFCWRLHLIVKPNGRRILLSNCKCCWCWLTEWESFRGLGIL